MCRYGFYKYKQHFACFNCQKTFKRRHLSDFEEDDNVESKAAKCPQCQSLMANMGLDFKAPKMKDDKAWKHLQTLFSVGIAFHSCGCDGPGLVPKDKTDLIKSFKETIISYEKELKFWRNRIQPTNESERQKEFNKYGQTHIVKIGDSKRNEKGIYESDAAVEWWIERIKTVEKKLATLN
jgi:hypothetical protein